MSNKTIKVSLVNHTHWDREWYFSDQDSLVLSDVLFKRALEQLTTHPEASFVLDGQVSVLEDFLKANPDQQAIVSRLSKRGQLKVGPWYTQPDALHIQGESMLRNGMIGTLLSRKYGPRMEVGYLPDTFGFNSQVPVILNQLGLRRFLFWRGIDPDKTGGFYFNWKSLGGGSTVQAADMPQGYSTGMMMAPTSDYVDNRVDAGTDFIVSHTPGDRKPSHVLIPVGNDQMSIVQGMQNQIDQIQKIGKNAYQMDTYEGFFDSLNYDDLPTYQGELVEPLFARVHRTCGSSRMDVKVAATTLESKLLHEVEPLMVIAKRTGVDLGNGLLVEAWKKLLESQAHDSMAGSVVDSVNEDILHRLKQGTELADGIINTIQKMIGLKLSLAANQVLVINPLPRNITRWFGVTVLSSGEQVQFNNVKQQRAVSSKKHPARKNVLVETSAGSYMGTEPAYYELHYEVKDSLPGLGYKVIDFAPIVGSDDQDNHVEVVKTGTSLVINGVELGLEENCLSVKSESSNVPALISVIDDANAGDTYDYSPLADDAPIQFRMISGEREGDVLKINCEAQLPANLSERKQHKATVVMSATLIASVGDDGVLKLSVKFKNVVADHRLRLHLNSGITTHESIASVPFGFIKHTDTKPIADWADKYAEEPLDVHPLDNNVTVAGDGRSLTIASQGVKEYWSHNGVLDLTMLASTDQLGKPDLLVRPGRASGDTTKAGHPLIPTPKAEMLNKQFEFSFCITFGTKFDQVRVDQQQEEHSFEPVAYQWQNLNLFFNRLDNKLQDDLVAPSNMPTEQSFLSLKSALTVSAVYPAMFHQSGTVIRLMNRSNSSADVELPGDWQPVNAIEEEVPFDGQVAPMDVLTIYIF